ncbi:MAG: hypothetical protein ACRDA3_14435 [Peptostreptococcaceae bacterium]
MYLPDKITKILEMINSPYAVHYKGSRISSVEIESESIKIYSSNAGCCMKFKGTIVDLRDLDSLEKLLIKFNIAKKTNKKIKVKKSKESIVDIFSEVDKDIVISYSSGNVSTVSLVEPRVKIYKTEFGYRVQMPSGEIGAENINELKVILEKVNVIPKKEKKKKKIKKNNEIMPHFEQLTLNI